MAMHIDKINDNIGKDKFNLSTLKFHDIFFYRIPTQSNIYSFVSLTNGDGKVTFLTPSFQKKLFCFKYDDNHSVDEVQIPSAGAIISMDTFFKPESHTLGITFMKKGDADSSENYFNIYSDWNDSLVEDDDLVDTPYCSLNIGFIPYHLGHTTLANDMKSPVFLLSGSDFQVHCFRTTEEDVSKYEEYLETSTILPEFDNLIDISVNFSMKYTSNFKSRLSAVFGDKGNVMLFHVDLTNVDAPLVTATKQFSFDYPSVCGQFFTSVNNVQKPSFIIDDEQDFSTEIDIDSSFNAVVATSLEGCYIIKNVFDGNLSQILLPQSDNYDVVTCCIVCDINFDGRNEIVVGTYGKAVLIYEENEMKKYILSKVMKVSYPVLSLAYEDYMGDGFRQLIVLTSFGVHIYSHDENDVSKILLTRLKEICEKVSPNSNNEF